MAIFKRGGLHRLTCICGGYVYATVATLETRGMPKCPCGEEYEPERLELAMLLDADDSSVMIAYRSKCSSVAHGQAWTGRNSRTMAQPEMRAYESITLAQRAEARKRRVDALKATQEIPF